jgi:predicted outer membrane protein
MRISKGHPLALAAIMFALATPVLAQGGTSGSSSSSTKNSAAGTVDLSAYPTPPLAESELKLLRQMSDGDILGHLITVDSMEVATADSARRILKSDDMLDYAKMMRSAHSVSLERNRALAKETSITPIQMFGGLRASHVAASLDSVHLASDVQLDRHYIMSQVELHQHVLAELEALQNTAQNTALRERIAATIPAVRDHLARAHALAVHNGFEKKRG